MLLSGVIVLNYISKEKDTVYSLKLFCIFFVFFLFDFTYEKKFSSFKYSSIMTALIGIGMVMYMTMLMCLVLAE